MIGFCKRILTFTQQTDRVEFVDNSRRYDATLRNIELVGEAATHMPEYVRRAHPGIPWQMIIATRNHPIHGSVGMDDDVPWRIVQTDNPTL